MTTIAQTLLDIEKVQQDIKRQLDNGKVQSSKFIEDIMNIIGVYHFDLLAHSSLDAAKTELSNISNPFLVKYRSLSRKDGMHNVVSNIFEKFVRETHGQLFKDVKIKHLKDAYEHILQSKNIDNPTLSRMVREFSLIRFIRNSFYHADTYTNPKTRTFVLGGETYELEEGKSVKPIRLMTAITIFWQHYFKIMSSP
ncbi:MAG: hypothetical protein JRI72_07970 [Deltaproteobacteria bacterium]|nr:hypothetical protein [Deltaproteobacteria bacterium]